MENQAQQNQPQPKQKQNNLNVKKILKLVFLGNGKYWPTTVFFWIGVIYLLIGLINSYYWISAFDSIFWGGAFYIGLFSGVLLYPIYFIPGVSQFIDSFKGYKVGLGDIGFEITNPIPFLILWLIIILLVNFLIVRFYKGRKYN